MLAQTAVRSSSFVVPALYSARHSCVSALARSAHTSAAAKPCYKHPRDQLVETLTRIYKYKMTTTSGGNLSVKDENADMWITPASVDKGTLTRKDIICVRPDGSAVGPHPPSSETPFHRAIYKTRPEFKAIVHAHPTSLVAYSACGVIPETRALHQSFEMCGTPVNSGYGCPGSQALADHISNAFASPSKPGCVILDHHGVVVGGSSLRHAFQRFETLEFTANTLIRAKQLAGADGVRLLTDAQLGSVPSMAGTCPNKCGKGVVAKACAVSTQEIELRTQLAAFIQRGYQQRLFISTEGSFSAKLDNKSFVISACGVDRANMTTEDFVLVHHENGKVVSVSHCNGHMPSRAMHLHAAIYAKHGPIGAIVNACPTNATAFGLTDVPFDTRTIPEAYLFLRDIQKLPFGVQFEENGAPLADIISPRNPIALLANDGVIVTGKDVLHAFDRTEVLESTAEALVKSRPVGKFVAMPQSATDELNQVYGAFIEKMAS